MWFTVGLIITGVGILILAISLPVALTNRRDKSLEYLAKQEKARDAMRRF